MRSEDPARSPTPARRRPPEETAATPTAVERLAGAARRARAHNPCHNAPVERRERAASPAPQTRRADHAPRRTGGARAGSGDRGARVEWTTVSSGNAPARTGEGDREAPGGGGGPTGRPRAARYR